ncbi:major capsid protein [Apis mellifera associated microvirus 45]|nr:major capsid protein [Apis mellifera associated microvirus 45]
MVRKERKDMKRSKFSLSHYKLLSCSMGELVPIGLVEVLPGDTVQHATQMLLRVLPLQAPVMHPVHVRVHHWFVPHRLVWEEWEDFITGGPDGMDDSSFPIINTPASTGFAVGSLADYLGVPPSVASRPVSALPFRAYAKIFNEWYRDQDLQTPLVISEASGTDTTTSTALVNVAWEKDYFTTARPWEQKGPQVSIPLTGDAPIVPSGPGAAINLKPQGTQPADSFMGWKTAVGLDFKNAAGATNDSYVGLGTPSGMKADLSAVTSASINDLRLAMALQRYEEARARYGSRYVEYLRYLGVRSSDARLQRPEYLGGGKQTIQFSEVLQTTPTTDGDDTVGVGNLKGHGIAAMRSNRYRRFFEEHGYVISLLSVRPRTMYVDGLARTWNRRTKEDFWQKELQHIGQQEVLNKEVYFPGGSPDGVFGYQDRYDEYRRMESGVAGEFRTTLDYWHMAREFSSAPALNASFVSSNPTNRVYSVTDPDVDKLWIMANHSIQARRMVARTGTSFGL